MSVPRNYNPLQVQGDAHDALVDALAGYSCPTSKDMEQHRKEVANDMAQILALREKGPLYREVRISKGEGKEDRITWDPLGPLKATQKRLNELLKRDKNVSDNAIGFVPGVNPFSKIKQGIESCHGSIGGVLQIDLKDFFPSIKKTNGKNPAKQAIGDFFGRIFGIDQTTGRAKIKNGPKLESDVIREMTRWASEICLHGDSVPQGAPTSPALSNMVMINFDKRMHELSEEHGIRYLRYADDMTFISEEAIPDAFATEVLGIIEEETEFAIAEDKYKLENGLDAYEILGAHVPAKSALTEIRLEASESFVAKTLKELSELIDGDFEEPELTTKINRCIGHISHAVHLTAVGGDWRDPNEYPRVGDEIVFLPEQLREPWLALCDKYSGSHEEVRNQKHIAQRGSKKTTSRTDHYHTPESYEARMRKFCDDRGIDFAKVEERRSKFVFPRTDEKIVMKELRQARGAADKPFYTAEELKHFESTIGGQIDRFIGLQEDQIRRKMDYVTTRVDEGFLEGERLNELVEEIIIDLMIISQFMLSMIDTRPHNRWNCPEHVVPDNLLDQYVSFAKYLTGLNESKTKVLKAGTDEMIHVLRGTRGLFHLRYWDRDQSWTEMNPIEDDNARREAQFINGKRLRGVHRRRDMEQGKPLIDANVFYHETYGAIKYRGSSRWTIERRTIPELIKSYREGGDDHWFDPKSEETDDMRVWLENELEIRRIYSMFPSDETRATIRAKHPRLVSS